MRKDDDEELYESKISWFTIRGRRRRISRRGENEAKEQKKK